MQQNEPLMVDQGDELATIQYGFDGEWRPDDDPLTIGPDNYKTLINTRYLDRGKKGVRGYRVINSGSTLLDEDSESITDGVEGLATGDDTLAHPLIRSGIQLRTAYDTASYTIVHAFNSAKDEAALYYNTTAIPDEGGFNGTALLTDSTGNLGRLSKAPDGHIAYCNQEKTYIWAGTEMRCGGFITCTDAARANPIDVTDALSNTLSANATDYVTVGAVAGRQYWVVFSPRPLKAVKYYVKTANTTAATLACTYYNGTTFAAVGNPSDGTSDGTHALADTGIFSFDSTVATAKPFHFNGMYMYAYQFALSAGDAAIYMVTVDAPFQELTDIWDGVLRQPIQFQFYTGSEYRDFTLEVNEDSYTGYEIGAVLDGMTTSGKIIAMFDERQTAIKCKMAAGLVNTNAATVTIKYWTGAAFTTVGTVTDGTSNGGDTLGQTGLMSWQAPAASAEHPVDMFGVYGYAYEITVSATLSGTADDDDNELVVDRVMGIPAQYTVRGGYKFPSFYKNMLLLCGDVAGKQGNRVDYTMPYAPNVLNGELSSMDGLQSLYFGNFDDLTAGMEICNRVGSNLVSGWAGLTKSSTYLLVGDSPEDYKIHPISDNIGCPAPLTLASAEVGYDMAQDVTRNILIWLSNSGPVVFDLAVITPIRGIDKFFKTDDPECINWEAIENARGWFDNENKEYNLLIPSGANQTDCNKWLCYDLLRKKWFEKVTDLAEMPQCGFTVMDTNGIKYTYGGIDTGHLVRLEYGESWNGEGIRQVIETGDFFPTGNMWHMTRIRELKVVAKAISETHNLEIGHSASTDVSGGLAGKWSDWDGCEWVDWSGGEWVSSQLNVINFFNVSETPNRIIRNTIHGDWYGWSHRFRFEITTDNTAEGFQPIGWGIRYRKERIDG